MFDEFGFIDAFGGGGADMAPIMFDPAPMAESVWSPSLDSSMFSPDAVFGSTAGGFDQVGPIVNALADAGRFDLIPPVLEAAGVDPMGFGGDPHAPLASTPAEAVPQMPEAPAIDVPTLASLMMQPPEAPAFMAPWQPMGDFGNSAMQSTPLVINPEQQFSAEALSGLERGIQPPQTLGLDAANAFEQGSQPPPMGAQSFDESGFSPPPLMHNDGGPLGSQSVPEVQQPDFSWVFGGQPDVTADTFGNRFGNWQQQLTAPSQVVADHWINPPSMMGAQSFDESGFTQPYPLEHADGGSFGTIGGMSDGAPTGFGQRTIQGFLSRPPEQMLPGSTPQVRSFVENAYQKFPGIRLTGAARDPTTNARVGGARGSQHISGNATDWDMSRLSQPQRQEFVQWARSQGAGGLGAYDAEGTNMHVDFRTGGNAAWGPNYSHTSLGRTPSWFQQEAASHRAGQPAAYAPTTEQRPEAVKAIDNAVKDQPQSGPEITKADAKPAPGYNVPKAEVKQYIHDAAVQRGIDPKIAMRVAKHEGLDQWQSTVVKNGKRENSFGPFQLYTDGGLGNKFQKDTGLDPSDPNNWKEGVDYALDHVSQKGWGAFYGAKAAGITGKMGVGTIPGDQSIDAAQNKAPLEAATLPQMAQLNSGKLPMTDVPIMGLFGQQGGGGMPDIMGGIRNMFNDPGSLAAMEMIANSLQPNAPPVHGLASAAVASQRYQQQQREERAVEQFLVDNGVPPAQAKIYKSRPELVNAVMQQMKMQRSQADDRGVFDAIQPTTRPAQSPTQPAPSMLSPAPMAQQGATAPQPQQPAQPSAISSRQSRFKSVDEIDALERRYPNMTEHTRKFLERERSYLQSQSRDMTTEEKIAKRLDPELPWHIDEKGNISLPQGFTRGDFKATDIIEEGTGEKRTIFTNDRNEVRFPNDMDPRLGGSPRNPYAVGTKSTEAQSKDALYANRMFQAGKILDDPKTVAALTSLPERGAGGVPVAGNFMVSKEFQMASQAKRDFINATLRKESGAVISEPEFSNAEQQYFPQPGDKPEVIAQKKRNRAEAIKGIAGGAGPQYTPPYDISEDGSIIDRRKGTETKSSPDGAKKPEAKKSSVDLPGPPPEFEKMNDNEKMQWVQKNAPEGTIFRSGAGNRYIKKGGKLVPLKD